MRVFKPLCSNVNIFCLSLEKITFKFKNHTRKSCIVTIRNGSSTDVIVAAKTPIEVEMLIGSDDEKEEIWVSARHDKTILKCNECDILELTINYFRMKITVNITKRDTVPTNNRYSPY